PFCGQSPHSHLIFTAWHRVSDGPAGGSAGQGGNVPTGGHWSLLCTRCPEMSESVPKCPIVRVGKTNPILIRLSRRLGQKAIRSHNDSRGRAAQSRPRNTTAQRDRWVQASREEFTPRNETCVPARRGRSRWIRRSCSSPSPGGLRRAGFRPSAEV